MWVKIDDGFATHPKIIAAGPVAMMLQIRAICYASQHQTDGFIPHNAVQLFLSGFDSLLIEGMSEEIQSADEINWIAYMLQCGLWENRDGGYYIHDYLEWNLSKKQYEELIAQKRRAGRKGMKARYSQQVIDVTPVRASDTADPVTNTSNSKSVLSLNSPESEFEQFWLAYPKKIGKKDAARAWMKAKDKPAIADILTAVSRASQSEQWKKEHGQYIPNPATWINQGRWADQPMTNGPESLTCQDCHKVFPDPAALRTHRFAYHPKWEG